MIKILFVCHGNICRSPMAEFIMKDLAAQHGVSAALQIASAATSTEEIGNPVYPPARRELAAHGIGCAGKTARQITPRDYTEYDLLICMDRFNLRNMTRFFGGDPAGKFRLLLEPDEVADPWYSGDFETAYADILRGCERLLTELLPHLTEEA